MHISETGFNLIKHAEGLRLRAYQCSAGTWTIGYGHTSGVQSGDRITSEKADELLLLDIVEAELSVERYVSVPLTQNQFDALVSFTFNLGTGNLRTSTLLKKLNARDYSGSAEEFLRWVNASGKEQSGLVRRRRVEKALFLQADS
ncbi:lysozyme [Klebsiella variicola]